MRLQFRLAIISSILLLSGCAAAPQLAPKGRVAPADVDFSGQWLLQSRSGPAAGAWPGGDPDAKRSIEESAKPRRRSSRRSSDSSVHIFLETGTALKITQTVHGFFISIDRSIVEELSFGEDRVVSVGPIEAHRVSGWEGSSYVVETLDDDGAILRETWWLDASGDVLVRDIEIVKGDKQRFAAQQRFDRQ